MTARVIDGVALSARIREEVALRAAALTAQGVRPGLAVILVGIDPASQVYVRNKVAACEKAGLHSVMEQYPATMTQQELLERAPQALRADVLVVPHQGSRSSSTGDFIAAVQPRWAVFPAGYRNRFGHPNQEVVERYRASGAQLLRTDSAGAVLVRLEGEGISVRPYRETRRRYWYAD